jgi:geranyl-CoA carboxylase beta subunit
VPGGSQIIGMGFVSGARCMVICNDAGINAGAMSTAGGGKILRAQRLALENRLPLVMLVESAGANLLEYRVEFWSEGGRFFANLAYLSAAGVPVITVLHGSSTAGGAYMPGLSDVVIGVKEQGKAFLAGPPLLKAATGEIAEDQELGGVEMHSTVSGLVEHVAEDDRDGIRICREVVASMRWGDGWVPATVAAQPTFDEPAYDPDELCGVVPADVKTAYDVREVAARIVDGSRFVDVKPGYGPATVCLEAEVHGRAIGIIGNNGPITNEGATKATQFIQRCCQLGTPLVFLQNITGYMVGVDAERGGMIKHGSKMIQAVANATVPKFTFIIGASFGAGNYGMAGQGYDPRFLFQWPNSRSGVMGAEQAATTMRIVAEQRAARSGQELNEEFVQGFIDHIVGLYEAQESVWVTSGRGMDDGVIDPRDTRAVLGFLLATVAEADASEPRPLTFGVARP